MTTRLTAKQEAFALALFQGVSSRQAYRSIYSAARMTDASVDVAASRLANLAKVALRVAELRSVAASEAVWTVERIIDELAGTATEARQVGDTGAALRAYELIGRHIGMWPRVAPNINIDNRKQSIALEGAGLSVDQLRQVALQMIEGDE